MKQSKFFHLLKPLLLIVVSLCSLACAPSESNLPIERVVKAEVFGQMFDVTACGRLIGEIKGNGAAENSEKNKNNSRIVFVSIVGVDPRKSKPWPNPAPNRISIVASENKVVSEFDICRIGDEFHFQSFVNKPINIRSRGALNAALPLVNQVATATRKIEKSGPIILTTVQPDALAILWSAENPYCVKCATDNEFKFEELPAGEYQLRVWIFDLSATGHERDPETGLIARKIYQEPLELNKSIQIRSGETTKTAVVFDR